jgi:hypothetical protein
MPLGLLRPTTVVEQVGEQTIERPELIRTVLGRRHPGQTH